jgi:hypothetical protein
MRFLVTLIICLSLCQHNSIAGTGVVLSNTQYNGKSSKPTPNWLKSSHTPSTVKHSSKTSKKKQKQLKANSSNSKR